jgi:hypothetical protein
MLSASQKRFWAYGRSALIVSTCVGVEARHDVQDLDLSREIAEADIAEIVLG